MKFKIDLHVHSKYSGDNDAEPEESIFRAIELGLHGIAFTEHYYYGASEPVERLREKYGDAIMIFRGVEFSCEEGHCLVFGADTDRLSLKYAPVEDIIEIVNKRGGVVIPSHPYRKGQGMGEVIMKIKGLCAVEGYNGCNMREHNLKAVEAAGALGLPYTGGSDAHAPREVGMCHTEFAEEVTYDNFIDMLKKGNYRGVDNRRAKGLVR